MVTFEDCNTMELARDIAREQETLQKEKEMDVQELDPSLVREVMQFLDELNQSGKWHIDFFNAKIAPGGWLRAAAISNLHFAFSISKADAEKLIDAWLFEKGKFEGKSLKGE
jgi:hypothetical protein